MILRLVPPSLRDDGGECGEAADEGEGGDGNEGNFVSTQNVTLLLFQVIF